MVREGSSRSPLGTELAVAVDIIDRDRLHRTAKIALDLGLVADVNLAHPYLKNLALQIQVGPRLDKDLAGQAALLAAINAGHRAMLGGVHVMIEDDPELSLPWAQGQNLSTAIRTHGGGIVEGHRPEHPVFVIGEPQSRSCAEAHLFAYYAGWSGGVVEAREPGERQAMPLAGVVAGALAVSEIFQHLLGSRTAAYRDVGLSLWRPDLAWQSPEAAGPALQFLPARIWLLGLGHLGQANAWSLGCLPYDQPNELEVYLVDFDTVVEANHATGLLTDESDIGRLKTRVVASGLEQLGHRTRLIERRFGNDLTPGNDEPLLALAGFDRIEPRRALSDKFGRVVDAGLGAGPTDYLDILIHTFPSQLTPEEAFPTRPAQDPVLTSVYEEEIRRRTEQGLEPGTARCGVLELAGATPAAAFVGAVAGALSVADLLRFLHGGPRYETLNVDLRSPNDAIAPLASKPQPRFNPGFTNARTT